MAEVVSAPFTAEQVQAIEAWQACEWVHPLTCGIDSHHGNLIVDTDALRCPECDYTQTQVPAVVATGELVQAMDRVINSRLPW